MSQQIGDNIRKIRELKGFSQEYMANHLGITQRAYSKVERQETKLCWDRITNISKILQIDTVDLVSFDDSLLFKNCSQSGKIHNQNNNFPIELKKQYEIQITHLKEEITFLRTELSKK
jgi:transcriptional regulator with XRE-family HTH domain